MSATPVAEAVKERSMLKQKEMIAGNYELLATAKETGRKVVSTFVPGNLNELIMCFDVVNNLPEINAIQNGMRKKSGGYIMEAEKRGHSEDVCTYVKADLGMIAKGNLGPDGRPLPDPDLLLLSYTGCFTFMKWFELLREQYKCETAMLHVPYEGDGHAIEEHAGLRGQAAQGRGHPQARTGERRQVRHRPAAPVPEGIGQGRGGFRLGARSRPRTKPSPIDAYFGGVYYIGPIFTAFRGTADATEYYRLLRAEIAERIAEKQGPVTPDGEMHEERYRLVVEGPPNWTSFRDFWKMFYDEGAVVVASTYTKVGGLYDQGFRHDPDHPLESLAEYCLGCYTNRNLPSRIDLIEKYMNDYEADGLLINSIKSCNSFSAGQLLMLREIERRTGKPAAFIETDLVDPRYFSPANVKNRLESYFQMIEQKRQGAKPPASAAE